MLRKFYLDYEYPREDGCVYVNPETITRIIVMHDTLILQDMYDKPIGIKVPAEQATKYQDEIASALAFPMSSDALRSGKFTRPMAQIGTQEIAIHDKEDVDYIEEYEFTVAEKKALKTLLKNKKISRIIATVSAKEPSSS